MSVIDLHTNNFCLISLKYSLFPLTLADWSILHRGLATVCDVGLSDK